MGFKKDEDVFDNEFGSEFTPTIYFSKSRAGNFDDILKVKTYLAKFNCGISEFTGGVYSSQRLDDADLLVILPPVLENYSFVGRGQYEEFFRSLNDSSKLSIPFIITKIIDGVPYGLLVDKGRVIDKNWTTDYGQFFSLDAAYSIPLAIALNLIDKDTITNAISKITGESVINYTPDLVDESSEQSDKQATYNEVFNTLKLL